MKVLISGPAAAFGTDEEEVTDVQRLKELHGITDPDAVCSEHLDGPLADIGIEGGTLRLTFTSPSEGLRVVTEYQCSRKLTRSELSELVEYTSGQWSDGIGSDCFSAHRDATGVSISVFPIPYDDDAVRAEQIDDGAKRAKPSPLFSAIRNGDLGRVTRALDNGEDIEAQGKWGFTPLMFAVGEQKPEAVALLISRGANVNHQTKDQTTSIQLAAMNSNVSLLKALIAAGAHVNVRDERGATPLMWAANRGPLEAVQLLTQHGADIKARDLSGNDALWYAQPVRPEIIEFLKDRI